jgi:phosphatidylglycerophosphate synthase
MKHEVTLGDLAENPVIWFFYRVSYPLALLFWRLNLKANFVSGLSVTAALSAALFLVIGQNLVLFAVAWVLSIVLDFCDGMVARMSGTANTSAFKLDHFLDLIKFSLITLAIGLYWNSNAITLILLVSTQSIFIFLVINQTPTKAVKLSQPADPNVKAKKRPNSIWKTAMITLGTFHAGTLSLIAFAPITSSLTGVVYIYIFFIGIVMVIRLIRILRLQPKVY